MEKYSILLALVLLLIVVLNVFDFISTSLVISKGRGTEANPIETFAMKYLGPWWWITKLPILPVCYGVWYYRNAYPEQVWVSAAVMAILYVYIVINNYKVLWRQV